MRNRFRMPSSTRTAEVDTNGMAEAKSSRPIFADADEDEQFGYDPFNHGFSNRGAPDCPLPAHDSVDLRIDFDSKSSCIDFLIASQSVRIPDGSCRRCDKI